MWVIGTDSLEERLLADAPEGDEFLGRVCDDKKFERLARAHVLLVTSDREGWGLVVTEAVQLGTPTIACDVPGLRDSVMASNGISTSPAPKHLSAAFRRQLAHWVAEGLPLVTPGGVIAWSDVAEQIFLEIDHAEEMAAWGHFHVNPNDSPLM